MPTGLDATAIFDQCQGVMPWKTDLTASGHPTTRGPTAVVGTYATTAGPTKPFKPSASDQSMLLTQLSTALAGRQELHVRSDGDRRHADQGRPQAAEQGDDQGRRHGSAAGYDSANGWNMINETTLQLFGSACDTWRNPSAKTIDFNFPCEIIVE